MTDTDTATATDIAAPSRLLPIVASASLVVAGLSVAVYALIAFTNPDWMIAGPGLVVAAAGVAGLRQRWFFLLGLAPIGAAVSMARPILAYDLARPDETAYVIGTVIILVAGCLSAAFGIAATVTSRSRAVPFAALGGLVLLPLVTTFIVNQSPSSAATDDAISSTDKERATEVFMADYAYGVDPALLTGDRVLHLRNVGSFPHDFTVPSLNVSVLVPPGRDTYMRLPDMTSGSTLVYCTIGNHRSRGMELEIPAP